MHDDTTTDLYCEATCFASLTSSPVSEGSASASNEPGCEPQPSAKSIPIADESSPITGQTCRSTMTSANLTAFSTPEQLTLFAVDTPASHSPSPGTSVVKPIRGTSGRRCAESFEKSAPAGSFPRMFMDTLSSVSTPLQHNWKRTATPSGRLLFQRVQSEPHTPGKGCGWWATPNTMDYLPQRSPESLLKQRNGTRKGRSRPANLREQVNPWTVELWETGVIPSWEAPIGYLNLEWEEWLMGYRANWTNPESGHSATPSSPRFPNSSDEPSSTTNGITD